MNQALYDEAERVLPFYPIKVTKLKLFQGEGGKKALWRLTSPQGEFLLKRSHYPPEKILFSIYGQLYVLEKGARVPPILLTRDGLPYVNMNGTVYIVYHWYTGARNPNFIQKEDLKRTLIALAQFHRTLEGYIPPVACNEKWRLGKGTRGYEKMINQLIQLNNKIQKEKSEYNSLVVEYLPTAIHRSEVVLDRLKQAGFDDVMREVRKRRLLTHEDFGEPNALIVNQQGFVIDIDGLSYNLPSRELARIIIKGIRKQGFNERRVQQMIAWYELEYPLTKREKEVMLLEMSLPNQFLRILNSDIRDGNISSGNYSKVIHFEEEKYELLDRIKL